MKKLNTKKPGFTIIEVVLVLAIAGLIFMMVFIAYPALRRSQRDTQRQNDVSRVVTAIQNYEANNRGKAPEHGNETDFVTNYLKVGSDGAADSFEDPDGSAYTLNIVACGTPTSGECAEKPATSFKDQGHVIKVVTKAVCEGETIKESTGERNIAVTYKKEGGGVICQSV